MNYYEILGLSQTASSDAINSKHKTLAKMYHPDVNSSEDANEKMAMLNEANEVLSDTKRREAYDNKLKRDHQQSQSKEKQFSQPVNAKSSYGIQYTGERKERAEIMRRKTEARLKNVEAARTRRIEREKRKADERIQKFRQFKEDIDKQQVLNVLSDIVMDGNAQQTQKSEDEKERHDAAGVLLSLLRKDDKNLLRVAEEAERKQRIEEILSLVKEYNNESNPDRLV